jgi:hypothetical protein
MGGQKELAERIDELERQVEQQGELIQRQNREIERLRSGDRADTVDPREEGVTGGDRATGREPAFTRRDYLKSAALGGAGLAIGGVGWSLIDGDRQGQMAVTDELRLNTDGSIQGRLTGNRRLADIAGANLWIDSDGVLNAEGAETGSLNDGGIVAQPGSVQDAIDRAAANGSGIVRLDPTQTYVQDASFPWHVRAEVVLDFNGAILYGSGEHPTTDILHVHPSGQVHNPKIDLWDEWNAYSASNPYDGTVFTFDAKYGGYFADGTTVRGGWTKAVASTGTWMYFGKNNATDSRVNALTSFVVETSLRKPKEPAAVSPSVIETGVHLDSSGPDGFLNSLVIRTTARGANTMILQEGTEPNNAHVFDGVFQPPDGADHFWHIKPDTFAKDTVVRGRIWDVNTKTYPGGIAWSIGEGDGEVRRNAIRASGFDPSFVRNDSSWAQYVTDPNTNETTVV